MIAGPGNEKAAALVGCGHLRASHADRERVVDTLKTAFVQGQLTNGEFGERIGQAHASRTYADLAAVTAGISVGPAGARLPHRPPRRQLSSGARWGISGLFTPVVLAAAAAFAWLGGDGRSEPVAFVIAFAYFVFWLSTGADMFRQGSHQRPPAWATWQSSDRAHRRVRRRAVPLARPAGTRPPGQADVTCS